MKSRLSFLALGVIGLISVAACSKTQKPATDNQTTVNAAKTNAALNPAAAGPAANALEAAGPARAADGKVAVNPGAVVNPSAGDHPAPGLPANENTPGSAQANSVADYKTKGLVAGDTAAAPSPTGCQSAEDCFAWSDYCDGCNCRPLAKSATPPACKGKLVQCFRNPCDQSKPACVRGQCVLSGERF